MNIGGYVAILILVALLSFSVGHSFGYTKALDWVIEMLDKMKRLHEKTENGYAEEKEE